MDEEKFEVIMSLLVPRIIHFICENYFIDEIKASSDFYKSKVYSFLEDESTKFGHFSPLTL